MSSDTYYTVDFGVNFANPKRYSEKVLDQIMADSYDGGVDKVVCISNNIKESIVNTTLQAKYQHMYFTVGIHPHNASSYKESDKGFIETTYTTQPKCYGIGECGLDYSRMFSPKEKQLEVFAIQVDSAKRLDANLYLHCRDAYDDFIRVLKEFNY